jgi:peptide/nickel transport system substrate-binding protein
MLDGADGAIRPTRRGFIQGATTAAALAGLSSASTRALAASSRAKTLVVAAPATPLSLDVENSLSLGTIDTVGAFYDYLIAFDMVPDPKVPGAMRENLAPNPSAPGGYNLKGKLAESWEFAPDGKTARFRLREGVVSNYGNPLTAADVKYTFDRKFEVKGAGAFMTGVMGLSSKDQVKVEGERVVSFNLDKPNPILMIVCGHLANPIFDAKKCKDMATADDPWARHFLDTNVAGFGPYALKEVTRGQQLVATARSDYYGAKPYFDTVIFKEVPTSSSRLQLLKGGAVDIAQLLAPIEMKNLAADPKATVASFDASQMLWIELNTKFKPLNDARVRQAINFAIPRKAILDTVLQGYGAKQTAVMPLFYPGATNKFWAYDTDAAKAKGLLKDAGLADGFSTVLAYNAGDPIEEPIAIMVQTALKEIGVKLDLKKLPAGTFFDSLTKRTEPMTFNLDAPWTPDPGFSLNLYFKSTSFVDFSNFSNPEVDKLIDASLSTLVQEDRMAAVTKTQELLMADAPWGFIAYPGFQIAHAKDLTNLTYYTSNRLSFQDYARAG